mmetsp:Transcript_84720/g.263150  ORF Transcript_84720/g.263150 Transcript_84720/m.263150 type:complete len:493 (+) Transcript_84720:401-1879(+)
MEPSVGSSGEPRRGAASASESRRAGACKSWGACSGGGGGGACAADCAEARKAGGCGGGGGGLPGAASKAHGAPAWTTGATAMTSPPVVTGRCDGLTSPSAGAAARAAAARRGGSPWPATGAGGALGASEGCPSSGARRQTQLWKAVPPKPEVGGKRAPPDVAACSPASTGALAIAAGARSASGGALVGCGASSGASGACWGLDAGVQTSKTGSASSPADLMSILPSSPKAPALLLRCKGSSGGSRRLSNADGRRTSVLRNAALASRSVAMSSGTSGACCVSKTSVCAPGSGSQTACFGPRLPNISMLNKPASASPSELRGKPVLFAGQAWSSLPASRLLSEEGRQTIASQMGCEWLSAAASPGTDFAVNTAGRQHSESPRTPTSRGGGGVPEASTNRSASRGGGELPAEALHAEVLRATRDEEELPADVLLERKGPAALCPWCRGAAGLGAMAPLEGRRGGCGTVLQRLPPKGGGGAREGRPAPGRPAVAGP